MAEKTHTITDVIFTGMISVVAAGTIGFVSGVMDNGHNNDFTKVFEREGKPSVMREYQMASFDRILVKDSTTGRYIPMNVYLETIADEYDRDMERIEIEKTVDWRGE